MISFEVLWETMKERGVSQYALINKHGVSPAQITRLKRNESVSTNTIENFCKILDCDIPDIMIYIPDDVAKRAKKSKESEVSKKKPKSNKKSKE